MFELDSKTLTLLALLAFLTAAAANTARTCYSCEGINCQRTTLSETQTCVDPMDICVTIFDEFNVIRRGCSSEVPIELRQRCDKNLVECHKCNVDRCNNLGQADFLCLQCDSSKDANCAGDPAMIAPTRCAVPTAPNSYCYAKQENGVVKRGCATAVAEQEECFMDANCMLCMPGDIRNCNNMDFISVSRNRWL